MLKLITSDVEYLKYSLDIAGNQYYLEIFGLGGGQDMYPFIEKYPQFFVWNEDLQMPELTSDEGLSLDILREAKSLTFGSLVILDSEGEEI